MTHDEILERVTVMMRDLTEDETLILRDDTTPEEVEKWDSLLHVKLMVTIESDFDLRFDVDELREPENVRDIIMLIQSKLH